jgi:hypothetical protein
MKSRLERVKGRLAAFAAMTLSAPSAMAQCSLCRDAVASSSEETRSAMNYAIIGLAFTPYLVAAIAAWTLSPAVRLRVRTGLRRLLPRNAGASR